MQAHSNQNCDILRQNSDRYFVHFYGMLFMKIIIYIKFMEVLYERNKCRKEEIIFPENEKIHSIVPYVIAWTYLLNCK